MGTGIEQIHEKIKSFKRKYYLNIFLRGAILSLAILFSYFLLAAVVEYMFWLGPWARFVIFFTFLGVASYCVYRFLKDPLRWWITRKGLDEEQSARIIGNYLPREKDRLVNLIQLSSLESSSALAAASIRQRSQELAPVQFEHFIDLRENRKYLRYLFIPVFVILAIAIFNHSILTRSADRIVHFNRHYSPEAPFQFVVNAKSLQAYYNEPFTLNLQLQGQAVPQDAYLLLGKNRLKFENRGDGNFAYTFESVQEAMDFQVEAAGFFSDMFHVTLINRPELTQFSVALEYPRYLQRQNEKLVNTGNLEIPEGTRVRWELQAANTMNASIVFLSDKTPQNIQQSDNQLFTYQKEFRDPDGYEISLNNAESRNKEKISYRVDVIKDQYPQITVNNFKDSVLYQRVVLGGTISDDYGLSQLALTFRVRNENQKEVSSRTVNIPITRNQSQQSFFYNWPVDSLKLHPGEQLEYYLQVWDNDGVNGRKSTKSTTYSFMLPSQENLANEIVRSQNQTEQKLSQSSTKAQKLQDQIEQANQKLKGKQNMDWQDKKMLEDIVQQKQSLDMMLEELKEQNKLLEQKKDAFTEQDERIREKAQQIQKLMEELLDEETKKLFEELQKLLKENSDATQLQKLMDKLNQKTDNLEKELERTLELFKQLQFDYKLDQSIEDIKKQIEKQEELLEKTESLDKNKDNKKGDNKDSKGDKDKKGDNKDGKQDEQGKKPDEQQKDGQQGAEEQKSENQKLAEEQEKLQEEFQKSSDKMEELKKLGDELDKGDKLPSKEDADKVDQEQEQSKEMLKQNQPAKAKPKQQKSIQQMKQMQQQMEGAQSSMSMEMDMQNIESLRQIIHGLVKLSFDQENLMKNFHELNQSDPRFNGLAQQQMKLKDDARVLEDSLLAIGKRDAFMGSIVTKEIGDLNDHLDKVIAANRERKRPQAASEMQQSMTSINNLALMLDSHFDMMMQMMANAKPSSQPSNKKGQKPSVSQMQQQLNQKIQELKGSGKSGRQLSEELAEMAAEQERIRKALQEMQDKMKEGGKTPGGDLPAKMEQTEMELVNKQLTDQMIKRQQDILTRLLETEKSMREQDMEEERKGETAKDYDKEIPKAFEEYLRLKEKEVELLKTVPPKLYPYYKKEVNEYFKRIGNQ